MGRILRVLIIGMLLFALDSQCLAEEEIEPPSLPNASLMTNDGENGSDNEIPGAEPFIISGEEDVARVGVAVSDAEKTVIEINIKGVKVEETEIDGEVFQILTIADYATTSEVGKPQLPVIRDTVAIPGGASVRANVLDASYKTFSGYMVYPFQMPLLDCGIGSQDIGFMIDREFYSQDILYPEELIVISTPGIWRDLTVIDIQINPVMFNPAKGELRVYDRIKIELAYENGVIERKTVSPRFASMYQSVILNYNFLDVVLGEPELHGESGTASKSDAYDGNFRIVESDAPADQSIKYFLMRHEDYVSGAAVEPLLDWRSANGLPWIHGWWLSGYSPTAQDIKDIIADVYANHPTLEYVLLVGDISYLPWYGNWDPSSSFQYWNPGVTLPSDYWYGCLSGNDLYPELAVGRLSVNNDAQAQQQINKILAYEGNPPAGTWTDKALLIANNKETAYEPCKEAIRTATYSDPFTFDKAYGSADATNADVSNAINNGRGIVNYRGHGSQVAWTNWNTLGQYYTTSDAQALNNGGKTPVVFSISCSCNALDYATNCLGEAFVKDDDSAVAFLGAARPSWRTPNDYFDIYLFDLIGNYGVLDIGWASNIANVGLINQFGPSSYAMDNVKMYLWLGDPALRLWTSPIAYDAAGLFRPSDGRWYFNYDNAGPSEYSFVWGASTDIPLAGDWNGDSRDTAGIFRPSTSTWYFNYDNAGLSEYSFVWGASTDIPVVGDWNGDGKDTAGLFRPSMSTWYFNYDNAGLSEYSFVWGASTDIPVVGDWNGDGKDTAGLFRPSTSTWYFNYDNVGMSEYSFVWGDSSFTPVAGSW